jgi:hypothetical protein
MVLFFPIQQELDCISNSGLILGKIKFDNRKAEYMFQPDSASTELSTSEQSAIDKKLSALVSGCYSLDMQDDD